MKLGSFVCPIEDDKNECIAIIVYDHSIHGMDGSFTIKWMLDGHISLRSEAELKEIAPLEFCKVWCKKQIGY